MASSAPKEKFIFALSAFAILLSSSLLFFVQPLVTKIFLPIFGGSPAVWNTSMVFFQVSLLAGYYYAHVVQRAAPKVEAIIYTILLAGAALTLPIGLPASWVPAWEGSVSLNLLSGLLLAVGLPFFVVSTASPLIQKWFSYSSHHSAKDPYFLYAISNFGSLAALLSYPLLIEPLYTVKFQLQVWSIVFCVFAVCMLLLRACTNVIPSNASETAGANSISTTTKLQWLVLAAIPSSLSLGVTQHLTTDVAAFPLIWVLPLGLYLLSFIVAFSESLKTTAAICRKLFPIALITPAMLLATEFRAYIPIQVVLHLVSFFIMAVCAHSRLSALRPQADQLTKFYLFLSIGGALGGIFNSLIAPLIFNSILEYIIAVSLAGIFVWPPGNKQSRRFHTHNWRGFTPGRDDLFISLLAITLLICAGPLSYALEWDWEFGKLSFYQIMEILPATIVCLFAIFHQKRLTLMVTMLMLFPQLGLLTERKTLLSERTFFGVLRVQERAERFGKWTQLWHGSTLHGMQFSTAPISKEPTTYFTTNSPVGKVLGGAFAAQAKDIAIVGLGTGTTSYYGKPTWNLTYFEIDPAVVSIASNVKYFTYLRDSLAKLSFDVGDARIKLAKRDPKSFDIFVLDAFSSDAIPIHLLTREAMLLYLDKLRTPGYMMFHITNRHLELTPVLAKHASDLSLSGVVCEDFEISNEEDKNGRYASKWVALARSPEELARVALAPKVCKPLPSPSDKPAWTDDYSNVLSVLK